MPGLFIERHARSVAKYVDVAVLYVHQDDKVPAGNYEIDISSDEELLQVKIYFGASRSGLTFMRPGINIFRFMRCHLKGLSIVRKETGRRPDLVHVNVLTRLGVLAMFYKWFYRTPYVITEHWTRYLPHMDNFKGQLRKLMSRLAVRNAAAVMPVTGNLRRAMESHGLRNPNYRIIPNVVDTGTFRISGRKVDDDRTRFIHVSCFEDKQKNISGLLRTLKKISAYRTDWECRMIGEGIHLEKLMDYAKELGIENRFVTFEGLKENEVLAEMMADARFQVMFSRFENLPVVILESYACGVPVLSTDVGGISEHMHADLGILIQSENEAELEQKINYMLDHHREFDKEKLRAYALAHFSREVIGRQLYELYAEVLSKSQIRK